jgi:hypothetical protein
MSDVGWKQLLDGWPWFRGEGSYPIPCYSEFMPPPFLVRKPSGGFDPLLPDEADPAGWPVTEYEEALPLRVGMAAIARHLLPQLVRLSTGEHGHCIPRYQLQDNPYWPPELAGRAGTLAHEHYVLLLPLALSRTLDDKGRVRWTLFGGSEQGPGRPFWRSFFTAPDREAPAEQGLGFLRRLLETVYGESPERLGDLRRAGLRLLPNDDGPLPSWAEPLLLSRGQALRSVQYLLTFQPFARLPAAVRRAYLAGDLHLLPCPASLVFWGSPRYRRLQQGLPFALQIPLLMQMERHEAPHGIRIPQAGWLHETHPDGSRHDGHHGPMRNTHKRTVRGARVRRDEDELVTTQESPLCHVWFSAAPDDVGLYAKPMARNAQLWTHDYELLLDGPRASPAEIHRVAHVVAAGGVFGYRFVYPAMRVGRHEVYWHRPLAAFRDPRSGEAELLPDAPTGYLTAYPADAPDLARPVELWPRLLRRPVHLANLELFAHPEHHHPQVTLRNIRRLLDTQAVLGQPLPRSFARRLLTLPKKETLDDWLEALPEHASDAERGQRFADELRAALEPTPAQPPGRSRRPPEPLTYAHTANRSFEAAYWKMIAFLSGGKYVTKNNGDPVLDDVTHAARPHQRRDLDGLGAYLIGYYSQLLTAQRGRNRALVGEVPFRWQTEFHYPWMGGWLHNQEGKAHERDIVVVIPGRDRGRAVLMCDHYDTAYMYDHYLPNYGGNGARVAAAGADDNCSATAALMLGAPIFLELSRAGSLACDVWLVHLTGEEYPAEGLGARQLCENLVEGNLHLQLPDGRLHDLSGVAMRGVYVLDMVAHNSDKDRDVFQIAPGESPQSLWLAQQAHEAAELWSAWVPVWNRRPSRRGRRRARRNATKMPATAAHLALHGEVRVHDDPRSTLYNTDGSTFSDAGVPVVLFMENYDIGRSGYHDQHDTMENIDLDYAAAFAAITLESVARAAAAEESP